MAVYVRKTVDFYISEDFKNLLEAIKGQSVVAEMLLRRRQLKDEIVDNPVNFISISSNDKEKISYLTHERYEKIMSKDDNPDSDVFWKSSGRFHTKPGVFVGKIFKDVSPKDVEIFSNLFKVGLEGRESLNFKVVKGNDIKKYYHHSKYSNERGTLGVSCMKYDSTQRFLDIYSKNPDKISMLVLFDKDNTHIMGRALLWNLDSLKIMDRIYTIDDEKLQLQFKRWATTNGYLHKTDQNWSNTLYFEDLNTKKKEIKIEVKLNVNKFDYYPYMDTFKFIDLDSKILYNYMPDNIDTRILCATDGRYFDNDHLRFDGIDRVFRNRCDSTWVQYLNIYTGEGNVVFSSINDQYILRKDSVYNNKIDDYVFGEEYDNLNDHQLIENRIKQIEEEKAQREQRRAQRKTLIVGSGAYDGDYSHQTFSDYITTNVVNMDFASLYQNTIMDYSARIVVTNDGISSE